MKVNDNEDGEVELISPHNLHRLRLRFGILVDGCTCVCGLAKSSRFCILAW